MKEEKSLIIVKRYTFYKDIYAFMNRLKNIATIKGSDKVYEALLTYFRGEALI